MAYAAKTEVGADRSKAEIEKLLQKAGAVNFGYMADGTRAVLLFTIDDRQIKMLIPLPSYAEFRHTGTGRERTVSSQNNEWEQACRARWRAVLLIIKAKLEAIEAGISTIEREFLADIVTPGGQTVHEWMEPQLEAAYETGQMAPLLPLLSR